MPLGNNQSGIYLNISEGKIVRRFKEPTAKTITRTTKEGKTVYEEQHGYVEGYITDIFVRDGDYGKTWNVVINDGATTFTLQMNYSSGYSSAFLKTLPNVDFDMPVKISPNMKIVDDKKKTTIFLSQADRPIKWAFNKENPGELPPLEKKRVKGQEVWDDTEQMDFLEKMVAGEIKPRLKHGIIAGTAHQLEATEETRQPGDDLPF